MARRRRFSRTLGARADVAGLVLAATNLPLTFQRTLMPRPTTDQAIVTGLSVATNHALVEFVQESIQAASLIALGRGGGHTVDEARWSRATLAADLAAIAAGTAIQRRFAQRHREPLERAGARTAGFWLTVTGTVGAVVGALQEATGTFRTERRHAAWAAVPVAGALMAQTELRRRHAARVDADLPPDDADVDPVKALGLGIGVSAGLSMIGLAERALVERIARVAARVLPGNEAVWRPLGHLLSLAGTGLLARLVVERAFASIEHSETAVEAAFDIPPPNPLVSASLESEVSFATLSRQGRRFVWTVSTADDIRRVMGPDGVTSPIRTYVGLESSPTPEERVALLVRELDRTDAWSRTWLLVATPTGTGYVNYAAVTALELLSRGDCATVAMQYAARPSVLSVDRVAEGRHQARLLVDAIRDRCAQLPDDRRPRVVLFGESLGAWSSQDAFVDRGTDGLVESGIDRAIWIGTPHFSKWKEQVLFDERADIDTELVHVCAGIEDWHALPEVERTKVRYVMVTHHDDGVALFGPELVIQAPTWLGDADTRPPGVPKGMRWFPSTTFFQVLVDMKNSANVVPGKFAAKGHDYRADLLPFFNAALGFDATEEQLAAIRHFLEESELQRTQWIKEHGDAGRSLAVAVVERAVQELQAEGVDANARLAELVRAIAHEELGAGGGATVPGE